MTKFLKHLRRGSFGSRRLLFLFLGIPFYFGSASASDRLKLRALNSAHLCRTASSTQFFGSANVICLNGPIDYYRKLVDQIEAFPVRDRVMVVANSDGGSAKYAIELSRHLRPFNYNVTVADHCFSACSQFIFLGARRKYLLDDGLIAFHGAAPTDQQIDEMDLSQTNKDLLKAEGAAFRDFFREIGVSYWLIDTLPKRLRGKIDIVREFWIPTMCELRENGVKSVERINSRNFSPDC